MSAAFLQFIIRLGLVDRYFETSAERLVLTRSEFESLNPLVRKGYFPAAEIEHLRSQGLITTPPRSQRVDEAEEDIDAPIRQTVETYRALKAKFILMEDDNLRSRLQEAGLNVIATPDIIAHMAKKGVISRQEAIESLEALRLFGWHDGEVLDRIKIHLQEETNYAG